MMEVSIEEVETSMEVVEASVASTETSTVVVSVVASVAFYCRSISDYHAAIHLRSSIPHPATNLDDSRKR